MWLLVSSSTYCGGAGPTAETAPSATGLHSDKNTPTGERDDCLINARLYQ